MATKTEQGNYFEDFEIGQRLVHATPRTLTEGDVALYQALYGSRFALGSSSASALRMGLERWPIDSLLVFHMVFGKTVPDISLNAVANLGYAGGAFDESVYAGDTITATSEVIGLKENSNGKTGVVYVNSVGRKQDGKAVVDYVRWVMVKKRDPSAPAPETVIPDLPTAVTAERLVVPYGLHGDRYDVRLAGSPYLWEDYEVGEKIDHVDGMTIEEAEHQMATRLYQNTSRVHLNQHAAAAGGHGRRLVYGGHIISIARSLSFNGLANAQRVLAINAGSHTNPSFAGDTIYAWSEVLECMELPGRSDLGALRVRTVAVKNESAADFSYKDENGKYEPNVVLDFDYTVLIPRKR